MKKMKRNTLYGMIGVLIALIIGFGISFGVRDSNKIKIGINLSTLNNPFFKTMADGAQEEADKLDIELIITDSTNDSGKSAANMDNLLAMNVDGIIVNPVDSSTIGTSIVKANNKNVPVVTVDRNSEGGQVLTHIASDNVAGARLATEHIFEVLDAKEPGGSFNIGELQGVIGASAAIDRGEGYESVIIGNNQMTTTNSETANFDRAEAKGVVDTWAAAGHLDNMDAIFAHNDEMALGAYTSLKSPGVDKTDIVVVGFDATDDAINSIKNGEMTATVGQDPAWMGREAVTHLYEYILNEITPPESIPAPTEVLTRENLSKEGPNYSLLTWTTIDSIIHQYE